MDVKFVQPIDGTDPYFQDQKGRKSYLGFPGVRGEGYQLGVNVEEITLSTSGLTTDSVADLLPANSIILAVAPYVSTAITVTTNFAIGDSGSAARYRAADATLTAGVRTHGVAAGFYYNASAAKLRITCTGSNPGAGKVRVAVYYLKLSPLAS